MELKIETETSTAKPESSAEDETSPLMKATDATRPFSENCISRFYAFIWSLIILLAILIVSFPFFIKTPDQTPSPTFHVDLVSVSLLNLSVCQISSNWNISFLVKNPKCGQPMCYEAIRVLVLYENEFCLSIANVESFYQRRGEESVVKAWLGGSSVNVKKWVVSAIETDISTRRQMDMFVVLEAFVTTNPGLEKYRRRRSVKVSCSYLKVELSSDHNNTAGSMSSGNSRNCRLKFEDES